MFEEMRNRIKHMALKQARRDVAKDFIRKMYLYGLDNKKISDILGFSENTIRNITKNIKSGKFPWGSGEKPEQPKK